MALVEAVEHFAYYLYLTRFVVVTDHKALETLRTAQQHNRRLHHVVVCPVQSWLCIRFVMCAISHILNYFNQTLKTQPLGGLQFAKSLRENPWILVAATTCWWQQLLAVAECELN